MSNKVKIAKGSYVKWFEVWIWGHKHFDFCTSAFVTGIQKENVLWWQKYPQNGMNMNKTQKTGWFEVWIWGQKHFDFCTSAFVTGIQKENALWWQNYPLMAKVPSEWNEIFAFQMNMNKTQKTEFKVSLSPLPIKGEKI